LTLKAKNIPNYVISSMIQVNINLSMFQAEFVVKKIFLMSAGFSFFSPAKVLAGNEF